MNGKTNQAKPDVTNAATSMIKNHNQSPRINGTKIPKNSTVHEKPSLTSLVIPVCALCKVIIIFLLIYLIISLLP